jgi:predicted RNase H-related nuclease YkuK (DUF458 family)
MIPERQLKDRHWFSGAQVEYDFYDILSQVLEEIDSGAELHVGTDSDPKGKQISFVTVIALYHPGRGGKYFWSREKISKSEVPSLRKRLELETSHSLEIAQILRDMYGDLNIAVHLDCNSDPSAGSSVCQKNLQSYVLGMGFRPVIKPESWAASCLADKKTKNAFTNAA